MSKIPFGWLPASWGLKGKSRQLAEAEYNLSGYELAIAKAAIEHGTGTTEFTRAVITIDQQYGKIDTYSAKIGLAELDHTGDPSAMELAKLRIDLEHNRISPQEHERKAADLKNEPFMAMPKISWDPVDPSKTFFELDYNDAFVQYLRVNGYQGSDEDCINRWLNDVCNSILSEMAPTDPEFVSSVRRVRRDDGKVEHS